MWKTLLIHDIIIVVDTLLQGCEAVISFGETLKQLRNAQNITQRTLAECIGLDFTYISKIETGAMPPPSEDRILAIEEALDAKKYSLVLLAGKIPTDFKDVILMDKEIQEIIRKRVEFWLDKMKESKEEK